MILSGKEIESKQEKEIIIKPFDNNNINPNSYNLSLHNELLVYKTKSLDMKKDNPTNRIIIPDNGFIIRPNTLYLGRTAEYTETKGYIPMIEGRSSIGRLGIFVHITAGFGDVGFKGYWTLEISCIQPVKIYPNIEICQIYYHCIEGAYEEYTKGKYQGNIDIQASKIFEEFREVKK